MGEARIESQCEGSVVCGRCAVDASNDRIRPLVMSDATTGGTRAPTATVGSRVRTSVKGCDCGEGCGSNDDNDDRYVIVTSSSHSGRGSSSGGSRTLKHSNCSRQIRRTAEQQRRADRHAPAPQIRFRDRLLCRRGSTATRRARRCRPLPLPLRRRNRAPLRPSSAAPRLPSPSPARCHWARWAPLPLRPTRPCRSCPPSAPTR